ncbi:uncharacterized protein LOC132750518 [Ruditapes philippinarum]|uniref:uncharacterized protein LOC132750518 n=1 Tax=Ruditapes philippinarum TaxID=129788 RepID=UPI00295AC7CC|nr:uncharacterized protein LOC132750518 [Ruditapes philippinarum]
MRPDHPLNELADVMFNSPIPPTRQGSASVRIDMSVHSDDSDEFDEIESSAETDEGRLSRSLQTWMIDHTWSHVEPLEKPPAEPLFSGKLGIERCPKRTNNVTKKEKTNKTLRDKKSKATKLRRIPSDDSIHTNLSLLTCSSLETPVIEIDNSKLKRQKKRKNNSRASSAVPDDEPFVSKWERLSNMKSGNINRLFKNSSVLANQFGLIAGVNNDDESEAFRMLDKDEQDGLLQCGYKRGIRYVNKSTLERSGSLTKLGNILADKPTVFKRTLSLDADKPWGAPIDIAELKRERMNRLLATMQAKALQEKERTRKGRRISRVSSYKNASSASSTRPTSPSTTYVGTEVSNVHSVGSGHSSEKRLLTPSEKLSQLDDNQEEKVTVWKADREILEIDLKKELTERVKQKIESTRTALKRVTGFGDENEQAQVVGTHEEYPKHIEEDFCNKPRIIQRMRISPNLSGIIHDDIRVRMGRPRYHEIRESDMQQWNKGQVLNRAHRNLKVFNWLHSLKDVTFSTKVTSEIIDDVPEEDANLQDFLHVEAADEPDIAPLFRQYEVRIL